MARIKMTKTVQGSSDGVSVRTFRAGEEYEVGFGISEDLASVFVQRMGAANVVPDEPKDAGPAPDDKDAGPAPDDKDAGPAPDDKDARRPPLNKAARR
ncbi:MAG: hypothetical protein C4575_09265 [Desulforudis sp.]|nr:MAG: hypothetical protein C4575_09265 [Desulforudis sp.]